MQPDVVVFHEFGWGRFYVSGLPGQPVCDGWLGFAGMRIDATVSSVAFRVQSLSARVGINGLELNFSNAVEAGTHTGGEFTLTATNI